jgi:hypothetical protein
LVEQSLKSLEHLVAKVDQAMVDPVMVDLETAELVMTTARTSRHFKQP